MKHVVTLVLVGWILNVGVSHAVEEIPSYIGARREERLVLEPTGPTVLFGALDPAVRKWYVPQQMFRMYGWRGGWETTHYARDLYQKYVTSELAGEYIYDLFGNFVTQGWMWYNWRHQQPALFGSLIRGGGGYGGLIIASDSMGGFSSALMIAGNIRTTLTPMTFSKPAFNGIQWDFIYGDVWKGTVLASRVNDPGFSPLPYANTTALWAGRTTIEPVKGVKLGLTYVNAHNGRTTESSAWWHFRQGQLGADQLGSLVDRVVLKVSDDSPGDGVGAALYDVDLVLTDRKGKVIRGREIGFHPTLQGGVPRNGVLRAEGGEAITITYDLTDPSYQGPAPSAVKGMDLRLRLGGDYRVEVTSNRQLDRNNKPVFLPAMRAEGDSHDLSNDRTLRFAYGLPTARELYGGTVEVEDWYGLGLVGEWNVSRGVRQYPNMNVHRHTVADTKAEGWYLNAFWRHYPVVLAVERFGMDDGYSTTAFGVDRGGYSDYADASEYFYEFVDDNDDLDRLPDWRRYPMDEPDLVVFPGWDENNDGISDFNQNDNPARPNYLPDYEEPFLRYDVDRPEFLFGMDMNHNGIIDRFENDDRPDYPYQKDHFGTNVYLQHHLTPTIRWTIGQLRETLRTGSGKNYARYLLFTIDHDFPRFGRVRVFEHVQRVKDTIPDDGFQWVQPPDGRGAIQQVEDPLQAQNTWIYTSFAQVNWRGVRNLNVINKGKYELYRQEDPDSLIALRNARRHAWFLGVITKADYTLRWGRSLFQPKWKSSFRYERPVRRRLPVRKELEETLFLMVRFPLLRTTSVQTGVEVTRFFQLSKEESPELKGDFRGRVFAVQLTNKWDYQGYRVTTQVGYRLDRRRFEGKQPSSTSTAFVTVFVGRGEDWIPFTARGKWF